MKIHYCLFVCFCVQSNRKRDQIDCICFAPFVTKRLVSNSTAPYYISLLSDAQYRNPNLDLDVQISMSNRQHMIVLLIFWGHCEHGLPNFDLKQDQLAKATLLLLIIWQSTADDSFARILRTTTSGASWWFFPPLTPQSNSHKIPSFGFLANSGRICDNQDLDFNNTPPLKVKPEIMWQPWTWYDISPPFRSLVYVWQEISWNLE